ncbi:MAG: cellulase family glycosylhydrolase [Sedimentisphaerales bacterium]|jgi:hypothetical protein
MAQEAKPPVTNSLGPASYLHTLGNRIVDRTGKVVRLRGVNIGGWLVTEGWMCGQSDDRTRGALEQLEKRFGPDKAARLMNAWYDNWFTTNDLDLIQSWGFNVIRVPFGYRNLQDAAGNWKRDAGGNIDFARMDWVVREAARRGIYVIFDLHVWPRQEEKDNYGLPSRWSEEGKVVRAKMAKLWGEVAKHFKGNAAVAAFDIINEPEGSPWNAPQHAFSDAIRAQDPERMIIVETTGYENMPKEFPKNTVYSDHYAFKDKVSLEKYLKALRAHPEVRVPIFLGEMKAGEDTVESARWMAETMNKEGWNWTIWTYKAVNYGGWAGFNYYGELQYDLSKDSYESILDKLTHGLSQWQDPAKPRNYYLTQWWVDGFKQSPGNP